MSWQLANKGIPVKLWARRPELAAALNQNRHNPDYLSDIELPDLIVAESDLAAVLKDCGGAIIATPSYAVDATAKQMAATGLASDLPILMLSKGLEPESGRFLMDILGEILGSPRRLAVLSGPNHAEEVALGVNSATVIASLSQDCACAWQSIVSSETFRAYTSNDVIGVQVCAAVKNIIAIACGIASGLGGGDNTIASLLTRGVAELARLTTALGGEFQTCMGLAGIGDLIATCMSTHSRNRAFGLALAAGADFESYKSAHKMVVEGAFAAQLVPRIARAHQVDMPICQVVYEMVWQGKTVQQAYDDIVGRPLKSEF
jgi:glycerol-3-phosphate dehydrogenase (NAD(P)+)